MDLFKSKALLEKTKKCKFKLLILILHKKEKTMLTLEFYGPKNTSQIRLIKL